MAIPEMNGVGAVQGNGNKYELKPPKEQKMGNLPVGQGYGETNDVRPKYGVVNDYGGDIANFAKFKGNDKNDAMRLTNSAANDVKNNICSYSMNILELNCSLNQCRILRQQGKSVKDFLIISNNLIIGKIMR